MKLSRDDLIAILEDLAVNGSDTAKVSAIRMLLEELKRDQPAERADGFAELHAVPRRGGPQGA